MPSFSYDQVRTVTEPGEATLDVYAHLIGDEELMFLCGLHARKRRGKGMRADWHDDADELYRENSRCADCSPVKGSGQLALL